MYSDPQRESVDERELLRKSHDPETIRYRDNEIDTLTTLLSTTLDGGIIETVLIHGPPESEKTCTMTALLEEIETEYNIVTRMVEEYD
ncbi:hypothetical protein HTG_19174 [Natrinema mahii]|nr:hypothetical protein HTG_19174 [Natrinema mahii]